MVVTVLQTKINTLQGAYNNNLLTFYATLLILFQMGGSWQTRDFVSHCNSTIKLKNAPSIGIYERRKMHSLELTLTNKVRCITCRSRSNWARSACMFTSSLNLASSVNCNSSSSSSFWAFCSASWLSRARFAFSSSWTCHNRQDQRTQHHTTCLSTKMQFCAKMLKHKTLETTANIKDD